MSMNRDADLLLQSGIAAVRSGDKREGARLLAQVVRKEPQSEEAWFWLAAATDQPAEAAACLRRVLAINPNNGRARQALTMLDTGQGQAAFNTGPLDTGPNPDMANRPLSTGDLISPYNPPGQPVINPAPPPPPFGETNVYTGEPMPPPMTPPVAPPPFAWNSNNVNVAGDPYNVNTMPSPAPNKLPPPPPFTGGGGVRLGQLDPNAPTVQINPATAGPPISDPGAELRASLLPNTPANAVPPPLINGQPPVKRRLFRRRTTVQTVPVIVKKKRRLNPLFLVLSIIIIFLAALIGFLLMQKSPNQVAQVPAADQTATAAVLTPTAIVITGTPGVGGTAGAVNGTPGVGGTVGVANGTPGGANPSGGTPAANGTAGVNGTGGVNATAGAGTAQPGGPTPTAQSGALPTSATNPGTLPTTGPGSNNGELPGGSPAAGTTPGAQTIPAGAGPDVPPPTVRDNRPPPEIVTYVNKTATYINNAQFFEAAIAEGIVKPYRAGRIKPGVTLINVSQVRIPGESITLISPIATSGTGTTATPVASTPNPTAIVPATPRPTNANDAGTAAPGTASSGAASSGANVPPNPTVTAGGPTPGANSTPPGSSNIPPEAMPIIINGPNGPQLSYLVDFSGGYSMNRLTLAIGRVARVLKDQPAPAGAYELNQVALEYANDLSSMANSLDRFFQTGQLSNLEDLANYYDKAVRDRERWARIVDAGYPFRIIL